MRLHVRVTPRSRENRITGVRADGTVLVRVTAAPQRGEANAMTIDVLCEALELPRRALRILAGSSSRDKWIEVDGIESAEAMRRLEIKG